MQTDLIIVSEYCRICHIEPSFLYLLQKGGLIEIDTVEGESYLPASQLYDRLWDRNLLTKELFHS